MHTAAPLRFGKSAVNTEYVTHVCWTPGSVLLKTILKLLEHFCSVIQQILVTLMNYKTFIHITQRAFMRPFCQQPALTP